MIEKLFYILLGIFLLLFGIFAISNLQIEWGKPLEGFAAFCAGIVCLVRAIK